MLGSLLELMTRHRKNPHGSSWRSKNSFFSNLSDMLLKVPSFFHFSAPPLPILLSCAFLILCQPISLGPPPLHVITTPLGRSSRPCLGTFYHTTPSTLPGTGNPPALPPSRLRTRAELTHTTGTIPLPTHLPSFHPGGCARQLAGGRQG